MDIFKPNAFRRIRQGQNCRLISWLLYPFMILFLYVSIWHQEVSIDVIRSLFASTETLDETGSLLFSLGTLGFVLIRVIRVLMTLIIIAGLSELTRSSSAYFRARDWYIALIVLDCLTSLVGSLQVAITTRGLFGVQLEHGQLIFDLLIAETDILGIVIITCASNQNLLRGFAETAQLIGVSDQKLAKMKRLQVVLNLVSVGLFLAAGLLLLLQILRVFEMSLPMIEVPRLTIMVLTVTAAFFMLLRFIIQIQINGLADFMTRTIREISE